MSSITRPIPLLTPIHTQPCPPPHAASTACSAAVLVSSPHPSGAAAAAQSCPPYRRPTDGFGEPCTPGSTSLGHAVHRPGQAGRAANGGRTTGAVRPLPQTSILPLLLPSNLPWEVLCHATCLLARHGYPTLPFPAWTPPSLWAGPPGRPVGGGRR